MKLYISLFRCIDPWEHSAPKSTKMRYLKNKKYISNEENIIRLSEKFRNNRRTRLLVWYYFVELRTSILFCRDKHGDISQTWLYFYTKVHRCKKHVRKRKTLSGQPDIMHIMWICIKIWNMSGIAGFVAVYRVCINRDSNCFRSHQRFEASPGWRKQRYESRDIGKRSIRRSHRSFGWNRLG